MSYQVEFPVLLKTENRINMILSDLKFESIDNAEVYIRDNSWLSEHGTVHIVKIQKTIVKKLNKGDL